MIHQVKTILREMARRVGRFFKELVEVLEALSIGLALVVVELILDLRERQDDPWG